MTRRQWTEVVLAPAAVWLAMACGIAATCALAFLAPPAFHAPGTLAIAALQALLSATFFMRLDRKTALIRLTAAAGLMWLSFLFIFSFADYLTRSYPP